MSASDRGLECVIFDLDGLLIDSEPLQFRAFHAAFAHFGVELTHEDWVRWHQVEVSAGSFIASRNLPIDVTEMRTVKREHYRRLVEDELELKPGAADLVEELADGYRLCVASGSHTASINACLGKFGLDRHFEQVFSCEHVERAKPDPGVYLESLRGMGVEASAAVALEDSVLGLRAARGAGIACVVVPDAFNPKPPEAYEGAARIVDSLASVDRALLESVIG